MALTPEYQSLCFTNHTKSCPTYWHHILIFTQVLSSIISIRRHHRGHLTIYTVNSQYPLTSQNTFVRSEISCPTQSATRLPTPDGPAEISVVPRQSAGLLGTRDFLRSYITPRATMTIYNPLRYNNIKPIFATNTVILHGYIYMNT